MNTWDKRYTDRVRLLVEILPVLVQEPRFALKGGTAINLFEGWPDGINSMPHMIAKGQMQHLVGERQHRLAKPPYIGNASLAERKSGQQQEPLHHRRQLGFDQIPVKAQRPRVGQQGQGKRAHYHLHDDPDFRL